MKKIVAAFLSGVLTLTLSPAMADTADERKIIDVPRSGGWIGVDFMDISHDGTSLLTMVGKDRTEDVNNWTTVICDSVADSKCQDPNQYFQVLSLFSPCTESVVIDCIASVEATLTDGTQVVGTPGKLWNPQGVYKGDAQLGIPDGGMASSWTLKGTNAESSDQYVLVAGVRGGMDVITDRTNIRPEKKFTGEVFAELHPVTIVNGVYDNPKMQLTQRGATGVGVGGGISDHRGCYMNDTNQCAQKVAFEPNISYTLTMRFSRPINNWLRGRLSDPSVNVVAESSGYTTLTVSGKALTVPEVAGYIPWASASDELKASYPAGTGGTANSPNGFTTTDLANRILRVGQGSSGKQALAEFKRWIPLLGDKPFAMRTYWSLQTIKDQPSQKMMECARGQFAGLVTSNSTVYSAGAPDWNEKKQSLDYSVGAPHYDTSGNLLLGQYVLSIRSDIARCIYGFTSAPISAKVEIASEDGNPNVATTVINENKETGFLTLTASGFHYSTPQLSVKLMQEKAAPAPTPSPTTSKPIVTVKSKTIKCVRGKVSKHITGANPKCPTGWKKV